MDENCADLSSLEDVDVSGIIHINLFDTLKIAFSDAWIFVISCPEKL